MKFADHLNKEQIRLFNQMRRYPPKYQQEQEKPKKQEKLTQREWLEVMGANKDTFKRVRGAVRRR